MGNHARDEGERSRRLIASISAVLRAMEPADAVWQIRVHELARLLERAAQVDPHVPLTDLLAPPVHLAIANQG